MRNIKITHYSPNIQQISAAKVAGICFFFWLILWQDSQNGYHFGYPFYKSCEGTLSPSNLYSSHTLDFKTSEARLVSHKAKACSLWNPLRGITIAPHHKCATLHKTGRVRVSTCFVPFMPACGFTLSYKFLRK